MKWLAWAVNDRYTVFFPPENAEEWTNDMQWTYEWIWAYVEMLEPGKLIIVSPINWSPAHDAWIKAWDQVIKIDNKIVSEDVSLKTAISWIKWTVWTFVNLTILRWQKELLIKVKRDRIQIKNVESAIENNVCIVSIHKFWRGVMWEFDNVMNDFSEKKCKRYIFDVRNNPWWYLDEVIGILNRFVPSGKPIVTTRSISEEDVVWSKNIWEKLIDANIVILINKWSASASEIFAWVIKYYNDVILMWEKSFWKWSVQWLTNYTDGSMLKYTTARWYIWDSDISIDNIWLDPDFEIKNWTWSDIDLQLKAAKLVKIN
jgi:carboxyl-terminal processing protease